MYIDDLKGLSLLLVESPAVVRYFSGPGGSTEDLSDIEAQLASILSANPEICSLFLIGTDGRVVTNEKGLDMAALDDLKSQDWYKAALGGGMPVLTSARMQEFTMDRDSWVVSLGRELSDGAGRSVGSLRIDLKYDALSAILSRLDLGVRGTAFLVGADDRMVYHRDPSYFTDDEKRTDLLRKLDMPASELSRSGLLLHVHPLANADWRLVGLASLDGVARMQRDIVLVLWGLGSVLLLLALGITGVFVRSISNPVQRLEQAMAQVEIGMPGMASALTGALEEGPMGSAEIAELTRHFRRMLERIRSLVEEIRDKDASLHAAELQTLYSQVNPHFLYNTLDTIVWLAELGDRERVVSTCQSLARYLRLSLHGGSNRTTVREELDLVRQYLLILKERYGDRLDFNVSADESLLDLVIPGILLQPIVENAIQHGVRLLPSGGRVDVSAVPEGESILLSVHDNGPGFDPSVPVLRSEADRFRGVGLQNVSERIRLTYGDAGGLSIRSAPGEGTTVELRLGRDCG
jgi:two-component system sensor histidine kinase YesM